MKLLHAGLTCSSEEKADAFYAGLLGFKKLEPKFLPAEIAGAVFGTASRLKIINYTGESAHLEIFIDGSLQNIKNPIDHICLAVGNLESFLQKCRREDVSIIQVPRGDSTITFIKDFDGNLFELKGKT